MTEDYEENNSEDSWHTALDSLEEYNLIVKQINNNNIQKTNKQENYDIEKIMTLYDINLWNYVQIILSMTMYVMDIGSDVFLAVKYFVESQWIHACLTMLFVIGPSIGCNCVLNENPHWKRQKRNVWFYIWIGPYLIFNVEPLILYLQNLQTIGEYQGHQKRGEHDKQVECLKRWLEVNRNAAHLKDWEAELEAVPQLILQLYIMFSTVDTLSLDSTVILQVAALSTSALGLWNTKFGGHRAAHSSLQYRVTISEASQFAFGDSFPLICRAIATGACASVSYIICISILCLHWFLSAIWWRFKGRKDLNGLHHCLVHGFQLSLRPSFYSVMRCSMFNMALFLEDAALFSIWIVIWFRTKNEFLWIPLVLFVSADLAFRTVHMSYRKWGWKFDPRKKKQKENELREKLNLEPPYTNNSEFDFNTKKRYSV